MKQEIRVLGIDDSPFQKGSKEKSLVIGSVFRGGDWMEGIMSCEVDIDGDDATAQIAKMINRSRFKKQLQCIFLDGIAVAGFNVIDIKELYKKTKLPVVVVMRKPPNMTSIRKALTIINKQDKLSLILKAGAIKKVNKLYVQHVGITLVDLKQLLTLTCTRSHIPEPIRVSHIITAGIKKGESKGNA